jgi:hypothetical protein
VEVDVGQHPVVPLDGERIAADEEIFVTFEAEHSVARPQADQAGVGRDAHNRRVEGHAGFRIPARVKWRIEPQPVMSDFNGGYAMSRCRRRHPARRRAHL